MEILSQAEQWPERVAANRDWSTHPAYKPEHADYAKPIPGAPSDYEIRRRLMDYTYGKTQGTAAPIFHYSLYLNGKLVDNSPKFRDLVDGAKKDLYRD